MTDPPRVEWVPGQLALDDVLDDEPEQLALPLDGGDCDERFTRDAPESTRGMIR